MASRVASSYVKGQNLSFESRSCVGYSMVNQRGLIFATSQNSKQLVKLIYTFTFYDHIKNVKQILYECDDYDWVNQLLN